MRKDWMLSAVAKMDARAALDVLRGSGLSLEDAARMAVAGTPAGVRAVSIDEAVAGFLRARRAAGLRSVTLAWYARELGAFAGDLPERRLSTVTRAEVRRFVESRVPGSRAPVFRCVRALFRWGLRQDPPLVAIDPTAGLVFSEPRRDTDPQVLTPEQAATVLAAAGPYRAALAVALFAGLRPWELGGADKPGLRWEHVREREHVIRVPADVAKTRVARVLEGLPPTVWAWLAAETESGGSVCPARFLQAARRARSALGWSRWPRDITRHSFASYAVALLGDAGRVALWLGHEGDQRMLHRHYRGIVSAAAAQEYFALRPPA